MCCHAHCCHKRGPIINHNKDFRPSSLVFDNNFHLFCAMRDSRGDNLMSLNEQQWTGCVDG